MKKVSMQDIADELEISKNSVSQALRNTSNVSEETKRMVIETANKLGYNYAQKNSSGNNGTFLLIATEFAFLQTSFFGEIIESIRTQVQYLGYKLVTYSITEDMLSKKELPKNLQNYCGIFILSHSDDCYINKLLDQKIPCILVDHHNPKLKVDTVLSQNTDGTYCALQLLHQKKHQRVGFIGDIQFSPSYLERFQGYLQALKDFEMSEDPDIQITAIEETQGSLYTRLKEVKTMPDAWFCVNSGLAFMLNSYLQTNGYSIPKDISIICFDDTEFTRLAQPQITNVATNLTYMGELSVTTLLNRMKNPDQPFVHYQIVPELNERFSVN